MEEHFRRVEFGMASLQRRHSLSCQTEEIRPIDAQKSGIHCRENPRRRSTSSWRPAAAMPAMHEKAMEFLSRTWSPCSSDLLQILSPACTSRLPGLLLGSASSVPEDGEPADEVSKSRRREEHRASRARKRHGTRVLGAVVAHGTPPRPPLRRRNNLMTQPAWCIYNARRRRDELRLHAAQAHAAVSVAQLAAAVAGMVYACELRPPPLWWPPSAQRSTRPASRPREPLPGRAARPHCHRSYIAEGCCRAGAVELRAADVRGIGATNSASVGAKLAERHNSQGLPPMR